jgi:hypothetical protein
MQDQLVTSRCVRTACNQPEESCAHVISLCASVEGSDNGQPMTSFSSKIIPKAGHTYRVISQAFGHTQALSKTLQTDV